MHRKPGSAFGIITNAIGGFALIFPSIIPCDVSKGEVLCCTQDRVGTNYFPLEHRCRDPGRDVAPKGHIVGSFYDGPVQR